MDKLGKAIFAIILAMMAALFVFSPVFREIPMGELLLSPISPAVASVPEGLPAIISIILSGRTGDGAQAGDYPQAADG